MAYFQALNLLIDPESHSAPVNMAMDEILLEEISVPTLRVYRWKNRAVSFGYFESYAEVARVHGDRELVRRWTGGGVVPHGEGEDLTYSIIVPASDPFLALKPAESYRAIHDLLARTMQDSGMAAHTALDAAPKTSHACFENAVMHDVMASGQKIAGAAQRRTKHGLLHQGSIQLKNLSHIFCETFAHLLAETVTTGTIAPLHIKSAETLAAKKYATLEWLKKF